MFTNLAEQAKLPTRPPRMFSRQMPPVLMTPFPDQAEVRQFTLDFANATDPKSWLENQGIGETYSTNVVDADFLQAFARIYLINTAMWAGKVTGERFCELMHDLCELAQKAGAR